MSCSCLCLLTAYLRMELSQLLAQVQLERLYMLRREEKRYVGPSCDVCGFMWGGEMQGLLHTCIISSSAVSLSALPVCSIWCMAMTMASNESSSDKPMGFIGSE